MSGDHNMHQKWREHEAYAVPVTEDGMRAAGRRWHSFEAGWKAGIEESIKVLLENHERVKNSHNFYQVAANMLKELTDAS